MAKAMQNEPRRLLRDFQVLGERHGCNALRMIGDHPNGHEPLAQRQFRVGEDRPDLDRKTRAAVAALERLAIAEVINAIAVAVGAKLAVAPADGAQMIDASLFVREGVHQVKEAVKVRNHGASPFDEDTLAQFSDWVKHVYRLNFGRSPELVMPRLSRQEAQDQDRGEYRTKNIVDQA